MSRSDNGVRFSKNGPYYKAVWTDLAGKPRSKSLGRVSEAQAKRMCAAMQVEHTARPGARNAGKAPTLGQWRDKYFRLRSGEIKDGTETLHRQTFARLIAKFGEDCRIDRITKEMAAEFRVWLMDQPDQRVKNGKLKIGSQSVARHIRDCKVIFNRAVEVDRITANPFRFVRAGAGTASKEWRQITRADLDKIMAACPDSHWQLAFGLARLAGLRRGEILRLTWKDIDADKAQIRILPEPDEAGVRKDGTKQRERYVPMSPDLLRIIRQSRAWPDNDDDLRCCRIPTENIHRDACMILERSGVGRYSKPFHTMKKCLASDWLAAGHAVSDVAQWLGDSVDVLMKHYARFLQSSADKVTGKRDELAELRASVAQLQAENAKLKGGAA